MIGELDSARIIGEAREFSRATCAAGYADALRYLSAAIVRQSVGVRPLACRDNVQRLLTKILTLMYNHEVFPSAGRRARRGKLIQH